MIDQWLSIDASSLEKYLDLEEEYRLLAQRLERLELEKRKYSEVVYLRVRGDYEQRFEKIAEEVELLREEAIISRAKLQELLPDLREIVTGASYEKEELELRCSLGEFTDDEIRPRITAIGELLEQATAPLAIAERLNERFRTVLDENASEEPKPSRVETADTMIKSAMTREIDVASLSSQEETPAAFKKRTVLLPKVPPVTVRYEGTQLIRFAYLTLGDPQTEGQEKIYLGALTRIGRSTQNQVHLDDTSVSRAHAEIFLTPEGCYRIRDLSSINGTFINGNRVEGEELLNDGDRLLVGSISFQFHRGDGS